MKHINTLFLNLLSVAILSLSSSHGFAQSCNDAILPTTPDHRFVVSGSEVEDLWTGLIWQRCSVGLNWDGSTCSQGTADTRFTWSQALVLGGTEWRLPNIKELISIIEFSCSYTSINESVFPNTSNQYWSSTYSYSGSERYSRDGGALTASFNEAHFGNRVITAYANVRLVRDGD